MFRVLKPKFATLVAGALVLVACGLMPPRTYGAALTVTLTYTYSSTGTVDASNNYPPCSATVTKLCVSGFNIYDVTTGRVLIGTIVGPTAASGQQTLVQDLPLNNATYGTHTAVATAAYNDASGASLESADSLSTTFIVNPAAPNPPGILIKVK